MNDLSRNIDRVFHIPSHSNGSLAAMLVVLLAGWLDNGLVAAVVAMKEHCLAALKGSAMVVNLAATRAV